ncbi:hypothetical protein GCM10025866_10670 [Naasia aerilata]|uniref:Uncharacterized protein n=2 Tax=Naasia aerilata TaxID=1162966 RepID=A0ABM8GAB9_9MICO|nr:hypothetical protein GCM10025866_10670 [Naasia aerilata]
MFVAEFYFPHLRAAAESRLLEELERRRIAEERAPVSAASWRHRLAQLVAGSRRQVEECCAALQPAADGPADCCPA